MDIPSSWKAVIGLEIHIQLNTRSKLFCGDEATSGGEPNTRISAISLGYPGTLPRLNCEAVRHAVRLGLACGSHIHTSFYFERKNYTYPDLPKGYQITQCRMPVCTGGTIPVRLADSYSKAVALQRIQIEEDAGKSLHDVYAEQTALDYNRAGVALLELVTCPVLHHPREAAALLAEVRRLVRYLGISDGNMEDGSLRCDANISIRPEGSSHLGTRVEIKNLNSMRFVQQALSYEIHRQIACLQQGLCVQPETRLYNPAEGITFPMRNKEEQNDYRYFPEPDLPPVSLNASEWNDLLEHVPPLPWERYQQYTDQYHLLPSDAAVLVEEPELSAFFDETVKRCGHPKTVANWLIGPIRGYMADSGQKAVPLLPEHLAEIIELVENKTISFSVAARELIPFLARNPRCTARQAVDQLQLIQHRNEDVILQQIAEVVRAHPDKVRAYQRGKKGLLGFFMGEIMQHSREKIDPEATRTLLQRILTEGK
jgi:aspartyl-tRNA(Asn)/glutamyl-tRNA(Gln) amidotransferase subunit B